jgi:hypothetical protein
MRRTVALTIGVWAASGAVAGVTDTREGSFSLESTVTIQATPAAVYQELGRVSRWWDPEHTWSGSARNLSLDLHAGGCFCEKLAEGGSIQHGRVLYVQPKVMLRLDAPLGPLQEMPVTGVLTFKLTPAEGATQVTMTYRVSGTFTMESAKLAPIVDQVMSHQLSRLKTHVDAQAK